jgi:hypothetical protein
MIYIIFLLNIWNISVFVYVSVRYPICIRYPLNIRSISVSETIRIRKIIIDMNTVKTLFVRIRSVCNLGWRHMIREDQIDDMSCEPSLCRILFPFFFFSFFGWTRSTTYIISQREFFYWHLGYIVHALIFLFFFCSETMVTSSWVTDRKSSCTSAWHERSTKKR